METKKCRRKNYKKAKKYLTKAKLCDIISYIEIRVYAGVAELADARDLKSREANPSCRFDSGLRHQITHVKLNIAG